MAFLKEEIKDKLIELDLVGGVEARHASHHQSEVGEGEEVLAVGSQT